MGPTASGKSSLALAVARTLGDVELVAVDSMQVYRGMDIGTAKPTDEERAAVPHHLLDLADPQEEFSVARFRQAADDALAAIAARGHRALLVGGTGLYLQAVVDRLDLPGRWPDVRAELEADPDTAGLWRRLATLDPAAAAATTPDNRRRVVRSLEVSVGSGRPFSSFGPGMAAYPPTPVRMAGVWLPRPVGRERIAERLAAMLERGLVDEVRRLASRPLGRTARQALGYKELLDHLEGRCTLAEAVDAARRRTVAFARRQRMWFRRDPRITWYGADRNPVAVLPALLRDWTGCS